MKKFVVRLAIFGMLFFVYDKAFTVFKNESAEKEIDKRLEMLVNGKINKDLIVLGSSRGANDIIAGQLGQKLGMTAYNLSYPASNLEFHEFILRTLVKFNRGPKILLLVVDDPLALLPTNTQVFRDERLYPLVKYDYINRELVNRGERNQLLSKLFVLHRINKTNLNLTQKKFTAEDTIMSDGSMPISFQRENRKWVYEQENSSYNVAEEVPEKVEALKKIISICKKNNINLIFISPPNFRNNNVKFERRIKEITDNEFPLYIYDKTNPAYKNKVYFYDESHLNKKGAVVLTNEIAVYLNHVIYNSGIAKN